MGSSAINVLQIHWRVSWWKNYESRPAPGQVQQQYRHTCFNICWPMDRFLQQTPCKVKYTSICIALYHDSSLKRSGMARVNEGSHSFTCHPHVYPQVEWTHVLKELRKFSPAPLVDGVCCWRCRSACSSCACCSFSSASCFCCSVSTEICSLRDRWYSAFCSCISSVIASTQHSQFQQQALQYTPNC